MTFGDAAEHRAKNALVNTLVTFAIRVTSTVECKDVINQDRGLSRTLPDGGGKLSHGRLVKFRDNIVPIPHGLCV